MATDGSQERAVQRSPASWKDNRRLAFDGNHEINQCSLVQNVKAQCSLGLWAMERDIPQVIQKEAKKRDPANRS